MVWMALTTTFATPTYRVEGPASCTAAQNQPDNVISESARQFCASFPKDYDAWHPHVLWTTQAVGPPWWKAWLPVLYLAAASALAFVLWRTRLPAEPLRIHRVVDNQPAPPSAPPPPTPPTLPAPPASPRPLRRPPRAVQLAASTSSGITGLTADRGRIGRFEVYAASQVGLQHAKNGDPREDAYAVGGDPSRGRVFLAVADGLGSTNNAHAAARCASKTAVDLLRSLFDADGMPSPRDWSPIAADVVTEVARRLDPEAVGNAALDIGYLSPQSGNGGKASKPPACTLTFVVAGPFSGDTYPVYWAGVGDCELLLVDLDVGTLTWKTHNPTKTGSAISNATDSLPRNPDRVFCGAEMVPSNTMVVVASDGVGDAIRQMPDEFSRLLSRAPTAGLAEHTFAELVAFDVPGLHDDRTLVAAWPSGGVGADIQAGVR
jgi:serine/threonine protein phosphatase PrpC